MVTAKLSSKGQIILPKSVRELNHWLPDTEFSVENVDNGVLLKPLRRTKLGNVAGLLKRTRTKKKSVEDMDASIAKVVRKRHASGRY